MKKKVLSILLAATFTVSMFAGCGNSNTTAKEDSAAKTEDYDYGPGAEQFCRRWYHGPASV